MSQASFDCCIAFSQGSSRALVFYCRISRIYPRVQMFLLLSLYRCYLLPRVETNTTTSLSNADKPHKTSKSILLSKQLYTMPAQKYRLPAQQQRRAVAALAAARIQTKSLDVQ